MKFVLVALLFFSTSLFCIDLNLSPSANLNAVFNLALISDSPSAATQNSAIVNAGIEISTTYLFNMNELPLYNFHFGYRYLKLGFHFGNTILEHPFYREIINKITLNYEFRNFKVGGSVRHLFNEVEDYHSANSLVFDGGFVWKNKHLQTAFSVKNFTKSKLANEELPIFYLWEMCYLVTEKSKISLGFEKQNQFDFSFKMGARYDVFQQLTIYSGYQYQPNRIGVGLDFHLENYNLEYSIQTHQFLGITHYITIGYAL